MLSLIGVGYLGIPLMYTANAAIATVYNPAAMYVDWAEDGTNITVPISSFSTHGLTAALADGTTGSAPQVFHSLTRRAFEWYNDLTTTPDVMTIKLRSQRMIGSGDYVGKRRVKYSVEFILDWPEDTVATEV